MKFFKKVKQFFKELLPKSKKATIPTVEVVKPPKSSILDVKDFDRGVKIKGTEYVSTETYNEYVSKLNKAYDAYGEYSSLLPMPKEFKDLRNMKDFYVNEGRLDKMLKEEMMNNGEYLKDYVKDMILGELGEIEGTEIQNIEELVDEMDISQLKEFLKNNQKRVIKYNQENYDGNGTVGDLQESTISSVIDELMSYTI